MTINTKPIDLLVVGGGVNGAGIACDAAGRGLSVTLCEQDDLASATSSASSKLIHGGLRYLEHYEFGLVRKALIEREILIGVAPHIIRPLRFVLPHDKSQRPAWMLRAGLFLYDHLARHPSLPNSGGVDLRTDIAGARLNPVLTKGFSYYDCLVDDARLVVLNAMAARDHGAEILTRTKLVSARRQDGLWRVVLEGRGGESRELFCKALVNAAGPWAGTLLGGAISGGGSARLRLVKGSHILVPKFYDGDHAYLLQNSDGRVVFVIPSYPGPSYPGPSYPGLSTIGTTEVPFDGDPATAAIDDDEIAYLCQAVSAYFKAPVTPGDVVATFSGVRPLYEGPIKAKTKAMSNVSRDYKLALKGSGAEPPLLSVLGGKITTYRRLAEDAMDRLKPWFPEMGDTWTAGAPLPGGDIPDGDAGQYAAALAARTPTLGEATIAGLVARHGTLAADILGDARSPADLGPDFGGGLTGREISYMMEKEWAETAEDILWRRTKAGLVLDDAARAAVADYMAGAQAR